MPQTPDQHRQHQVCVGSQASHPISAQRNVEIVSKPRRQADVPSPPEVGESTRGIGKPEVIGQIESQAQRNADGTDGVAKEIAEDLKREGECSGPRRKKAG